MHVAEAATETVTIELQGEPRGKGRPRFRVVTPPGRPNYVNTYTDAATRDYENALRWAAKAAMVNRRKFDGPLLVRVIARMAIPQSWPARKQNEALAGHVRPTGKPDCDNILKVIDALNDIVWRDDSQVVAAFVSKVYSNAPGLVIEVRGTPALLAPAQLFEAAS